MSFIEREKALEFVLNNTPHINGETTMKCVERAIKAVPTADVVEVRHNFNVGDFCLYGFADGNKSLAIVEIVKILDDERGIAELKFHKVIKDNTGNGYFHYLFKSGHTMNGSFEYLKNITPEMDGERKEK
jgi:hypothetical protein